MAARRRSFTLLEKEGALERSDTPFCSHLGAGSGYSKPQASSTSRFSKTLLRSMSSTAHSASSSRSRPFELDAVIPLHVLFYSLGPEVLLLVPAVAVLIVGERGEDGCGYGGQNGHSKEHKVTQNYLLCSRGLLTVDKNRAPRPPHPPSEGFLLTQSINLELREEPQPAFR
jgi:hypothetical protein